MTHLVICYNKDNYGNYENIKKIISSRIFENIYVISTKEIDTEFSGFKTKTIVVDFNKSVEDLFADIFIGLKKIFGNDKIVDLDIAVNISSSNGKENTALLSALMKLGYGIRLIDLDKNGDVVEL